MRFDTPIYFQSVKNGDYNANTGDYAPETVQEVKIYASVSDTGTEALSLIYGSLKQGSLTIRLLRPYTKPFDRIRIGSGESAALYRVDTIKLKNRVFVVSQMQ